MSVVPEAAASVSNPLQLQSQPCTTGVGTGDRRPARSFRKHEHCAVFHCRFWILHAELQAQPPP